MVATCVILHNLCLMFKDAFDGKWLTGIKTLHPGMEEVEFLRRNMNANVRRLMEEEVAPQEDSELEAVDMSGGYVEACEARDTIAMALYQGRVPIL